MWTLKASLLHDIKIYIFPTICGGWMDAWFNIKTKNRWKQGLNHKFARPIKQDLQQKMSAKFSNGTIWKHWKGKSNHTYLKHFDDTQSQGYCCIFSDRECLGGGTAFSQYNHIYDLQCMYIIFEIHLPHTQSATLQVMLVIFRYHLLVRE